MSDSNYTTHHTTLKERLMKVSTLKINNEVRYYQHNNKCVKIWIIAYHISWRYWSLQLSENYLGGSVYNSESVDTGCAVWRITVTVYCNSQVIFSDYLFDQVVGAVLGEIVCFSIKCHVVGFTPDIAHTCRIRRTMYKNNNLDLWPLT